MMMVHHDNHRRPFPSSDTTPVPDAGGPTCNRPPPTYDDIVAAGTGTGSSSGGGAVLRNLQPFDIRTNTRSAGGMTTSFGFPFTNAQWKELERQAMIYKYMVASLPVPRDLLFPLTTTPPGTTAASQSPLGGRFNLRLSNSTDPEPGRCKRTDGKKWRCSRDVAPDQKYCERHMHRGRPRSRKHVEVHATAASKRVRHDINLAPPLPTVSPETVSISNPANGINKNVCSSQFMGSNLRPYHPSPVFPERDGAKFASFESMNSASANREPRNLDWLIMKGEPVSDAQWHQLMHSKTELSTKIPFFDPNSSVFSNRSEEESFLNLNSFTNFSAGEDQQDGGECNLFLNPDVAPLESPLLEETPRYFIDAWSKTVTDEETMAANSVNNNDNSSAPSSGQLSPSSLTLSMGGYNSINEEMGQTQMSLGTSGNGMMPRGSTWPASWVASAPGGPLAEVLKPTTSAASNPSSPVTTGTTTNGELGSPLAVSSPSGVLQKKFVSPSDSSGNSSPTLASSRAKPEIVSLLLNQSKA
ncbi:growth-regulating factor 7-like [Pyrus communis]|uniref:growth-regulating factor 7-like n=1 Tax=Pyrus communis TaxID=23211 RepID=UPI0035C16E57